MIVKTVYKLTISVNTRTGEQIQDITPLNEYIEIYDEPILPSVTEYASEMFEPQVEQPRPSIDINRMLNSIRHQRSRQYTTIHYPAEEYDDDDEQTENEDYGYLSDVPITISSREYDDIGERNVSGQNVCSICQDRLLVGDIVKDLQCNHEFHIHCLRQYFTSYNVKCPVCRLDVRDTV